MDIQVLQVEKINPAIYNPRKDLQPGDLEYEKLKKSILEFDMVEPLVWNKRTGNLVGGHQRLKILKELGIQNVEVSVVDLSEIKEKALNLALNKISGEWDMPRLKDILEELDTGEFDMEITGFDLKEIEDLMTQFHVPEEGLTDDDAVPEASESISRRGDLWSLGNHRLLCGDSILKGDVDKLMGGEKADMVFTDPPYGVDLDTDYTKMDGQSDRGTAFRRAKLLKARNRKWNPIIGDNGAFNPTVLFEQFDYCTEQFWWGADYYRRLLLEGGSWLVWDKRCDETFDRMFGSAFEMCWSRSSHKREILRCRFGGIFGTEQQDTRRRIHPTQKPLKIIEYIVGKYSREGNIIVDFFGGSGSTLIACEKLDRRCYMMEIDEHYCDVIIKRWEEFTGRKAVRIDEINTEARDILS